MKNYQVSSTFWLSALILTSMKLNMVASRNREVIRLDAIGEDNRLKGSTSFASTGRILAKKHQSNVFAKKDKKKRSSNIFVTQNDVFRDSDLSLSMITSPPSKLPDGSTFPTMSSSNFPKSSGAPTDPTKPVPTAAPTPALTTSVTPEPSGTAVMPGQSTPSPSDPDGNCKLCSENSLSPTPIDKSLSPTSIDSSLSPTSIDSSLSPTSVDNTGRDTTNEPTVQITPSPTPSSNIASNKPTPAFFKDRVIFECTEDGVQVVPHPYANNMLTTVIEMNVVYLVETDAFLEEYKAELEHQILGTALAGALRCDAGGPIFGNAPGANNATDVSSVPMLTSVTGVQCLPLSEDSVCTELETDFQMIVNEDIGSEAGAFLGYVSLQKEMDKEEDGVFTTLIPVIDRVEYLRPMLLLDPITDGNVDEGVVPNPNQGLRATGSVSVSPWTLGAVLAMCVGGFFALWAWVQNRRTRNRRHMQLIEDMSIGSPEPTNPNPAAPTHV